MAGASDFAKMVPGFDFLQGLMKNAGSALPNVGQWIAPTLDPDELEKRIQELKTVQFWLEQNARLLSTTIQALEVQRMTLATLKTMNLPVADIAEAFKLKPAETTPAWPSSPPPPPAPAPAPAAAQDEDDEDDDDDQEDEDDDDADPSPEEWADEPPAAAAPTPATRAKAGKAATAPDAAAPAAGVVDPMQWWGALTQQFTQLAAKALKETGAAASATMAPAARAVAAAAAPAAAKKAPARKTPAAKKTAKAAAKRPAPARRR